MILAPGKLVLVGEYAVLDGAGAIVAAVDRGVRCDVSPADSVAIATPGDDRFVRAALAGAPPARYAFSDWNPVDLPSKPGFGGSAAATVAAVVARGGTLEDALAAHHAVQGGGSGVDVFASWHGGVRRFPDGAEVPCPRLLAVWSGHSASTGPRVARYLAREDRAAFVAASRALVDAFASEPLRAVREGYALLRAFVDDYDTPAHARIAALAERFGGAAKPSGAGGGDVAVALFTDPDARDAFAVACADEGLPPIPVRVAQPPKQSS
ncbi:MAG: mevalonate kinase family protein [Myxococcota bacterium]